MKDLYSVNLSSFRGQYIGKCPLSFPCGGGREYKLMSFEGKKQGEMSEKKEEKKKKKKRGKVAKKWEVKGLNKCKLRNN